MTARAVVSLDEYRNGRTSDIRMLLNQSWPVNRERGDFRDLLRAEAETAPRVTICAHCETHSPELDGPTGRAWWEHHKTVCEGVPAA